MKKKLLIFTTIVISVFAIVVLLFVSAISSRKGNVNITKGNIGFQIYRAVGFWEIKPFSDLLGFVKYPNVTVYTLSLEKVTIDSPNGRFISFEASDSFDNVLAFYQKKMPDNNPDITNEGGLLRDIYNYDGSSQKGHWSKQYIKPYKTALFHAHLGSGTSITIRITQHTKDNGTSVGLTSSL